jgi:predicted dehydrogenase
MKHLILGLGSIGKRHATNLLKQGEMVVAVDPFVHDSFAFPVYRDIEVGWRELPDLVWICTPTHLHAEQVITALRCDKHVFVEKPLAHDMESARSVMDVWVDIEDKKLVWVACNMRFHPAVREMKSLLDSGVIGEPIIYRLHFSHFLGSMRPGVDYRKTYAAHSSQGGGILLDDIHDIDLAVWFGGAVRKVKGVTTNSGRLGIQAEDFALIVLIHENGALSEIHMDFLRRNKSRGIEVIGEKGTLEWRSFGKNPERAAITWYQDNQSREQTLWQKELDDPEEMYVLQFRQICEDISRPERFPIRLREAFASLRITYEVEKE